MRKRYRIEFSCDVDMQSNKFIEGQALQELECMVPFPEDITFSEVTDIQPLHDCIDLFERVWRAKEMLTEAEEKDK